MCKTTRSEQSPWKWLCLISSVQSLSRVYLRPHGMQHARPPCPSPTPRVPKLMSIELVMPSNHLILCHPLLLLPSIFPTSGSFLMSQFFTPGGQTIRVSASASVLLMNIQDWFPLGLTFAVQGLLRVFSNTTVQKHQFFSTQPSLWTNSHIHIWLLEKP